MFHQGRNHPISSSLQELCLTISFYLVFYFFKIVSTLDMGPELTTL